MNLSLYHGQSMTDGEWSSFVGNLIAYYFTALDEHPPLLA